MTPAAEYLREVPFRFAPSLFHWIPSDRAFRACAWIGVALSVLALSGIASRFGALATAALWAALRLGGVRNTLLASLIMGVAVSGMHYTGMAALRVQAAPGGGMLGMGSGTTGLAFLLPLILGITAVTFVLTAIITLAPTEAEIREDAALMERIARQSERA